MDINRLKVLLRAAETESFVKTAREFQYTQSGITHMISKLEAEFGFPLFIRTNKGVRLTENARRILPLLRRIVNLNEQVMQECALVANISCGNIRIAAYSSIAIHWIPPILKTFLQLYPNINVEILEVGDPAVLSAHITEGYVDLCYFSVDDDQPFETVKLMDDPIVAVLPWDHPLAQLDEVPLEALAEQELLVASTSSGVDPDVMRVLSRFPEPAKIRYTSNLDHSIIAMVANGLGISVMAGLMLQGHSPQVAVRPLYPPAFRRLGMAYQSYRDLSPAAKQLVTCSKSVIRDLAARDFWS